MQHAAHAGGPRRSGGAGAAAARAHEEAEQALRQAEGIFRETQSLTPGRAPEVLDALSRALLEQDKLEGASDVAPAWLALTDGVPGRSPDALAWPHCRCAQIKLAQASMAFAHLHFERSLAAQEQAPAGARDLKLPASTRYGLAWFAAELGLRDAGRAHLLRGVQIALELELDADLEALLPVFRELRARLDAPDGARTGEGGALRVGRPVLVVRPWRVVHATRNGSGRTDWGCVCKRGASESDRPVLHVKNDPACVRPTRSAREKRPCLRPTDPFCTRKTTLPAADRPVLHVKNDPACGRPTRSAREKRPCLRPTDPFCTRKTPP